MKQDSPFLCQPITFAPATKKAKRRARILPKKGRRYLWKANGSHWALMQKHIGFDRGGTHLQLYALD